ncbi:Hsp33 family molecular chaperone HslO [Saccharobesus litoralis]|uniref:33 kDa chaperonin n=1 Tax=Saccharobesus litoralis TaxID=2172099 RepID=A0A2S0VWU3_9ALTE|nr:Hsp33 family molecular chaperone HslO [Saccharobesus litoralis]AWB68694.1 Hsp33 family molecular chaperone HslO [Saccharobesus litoralis]
MQNQDQLHRYLFEDAHVRGEIVQLKNSYQSVLTNHNYPATIKQILGELLTATSLLTATLKFEGDITVQLQGDGPVKYIAINGNNQLELRGVARYEQAPSSTRLSDVVGQGYLVITITPTKGERYQGIVALEHETLAECLEKYFEQSEQLATSIRLFTDVESEQAAGILLQMLPTQATSDKSQEDLDKFEHLVTLTSTMTDEEIFNLQAQDVLYRLYHEENVQLFSPTAVNFVCGCSKEKTFNAIASINVAEVKSILDEQGEIKVTCEYCLTDYVFTPDELTSLTDGALKH